MSVPRNSGADKWFSFHLRANKAKHLLEETLRIRHFRTVDRWNT